MKCTPEAAIRTAGAAALALAAGVLLSGCGWTARDEYLLNQKSAVSARAGDGSLLTSEWKAGPGRQLQAAEVAARFESPN